MVGSRDKMLARIKSRSCYDDCRDSDPIQPYHIKRFPRLQEKAWQWEHQDRGQYATFIRRSHKRKNKLVEKRRFAQEAREELEAYYDGLI